MGYTDLIGYLEQKRNMCTQIIFQLLLDTAITDAMVASIDPESYSGLLVELIGTNPEAMKYLTQGLEAAKTKAATGRSISTVLDDEDDDGLLVIHGITFGVMGENPVVDLKTLADTLSRRLIELVHRPMVSPPDIDFETRGLCAEALEHKLESMDDIDDRVRHLLPKDYGIFLKTIAQEHGMSLDDLLEELLMYAEAEHAPDISVPAKTARHKPSSSTATRKRSKTSLTRIHRTRRN